MSPLDRELSSLLERATSTYEAHLELARSYLDERRIEMSTARSCRLGVVAEPVVGHEWFAGRLAIPYITRNGIVQMKFRAMDGSEPKYAGLTNVLPRLYNVASLFDAEADIAITEGELDAAVLAYQCDLPAVGCPGVDAWRDHFPRLFAGFDRVLVFADGDKPGREFAQRVASELTNAIVVRCPDGLDVNDVYVLEGAAGIRKRAGLDV